MSKSAHRNYPEVFKKQMVVLYQGGKSRKEIIEEYELTPSTFDNGVNSLKPQGLLKKKIT